MPITPTELIDQMQKLSQLLDVAMQELKNAANEYAKAENEYRQARATSYLKSAGTIPEREAFRDLAVTAEHLRVTLAEGRKRVAEELLRNRRAQLDALRSVMSSVRSEMELAR